MLFLKGIMQKKELYYRLKEILEGRLAIIGIGNTLRGDDGFGPEVIIRLKRDIVSIGKQAERFLLLDVGEAPENFFKPISDFEPERILAIDAVYMNKKPGEISIVPINDLAEQGISTHGISLKLSLSHLADRLGIDVYLLAVQPENMGIGQPISHPVNKSIEEILTFFKQSFN